MTRNYVRTLTFAVVALLIGLSVGLSEAKPKIIRGSVTDESNAPIPNAQIELSCVRHGKALTLATVRSGTDGHFQFEAPSFTECKLKMTAVGFTSTIIPISGSEKHAVTDLGKIQLRVSCTGPGVICDEVTPSPPKF